MLYDLMKKFFSFAALTLSCIAPLTGMAWGAIAVGNNDKFGVSVDAPIAWDINWGHLGH